jgi:DnaK suppressor protein
MTKRHAQLKALLVDRRHELQADVQRRIRDGRSDREHVGGDDLEVSDANTFEDVEFALLQMKSEALARVDHALLRLEAGEYGSCVLCDVEIAESRLRAIPFAVRCRACEEDRERGQVQSRRLDQQLAALTVPS